MKIVKGYKYFKTAPFIFNENNTAAKAKYFLKSIYC